MRRLTPAALAVAALLSQGCDTPSESKKQPSTPVAPIQTATIINADAPAPSPAPAGTPGAQPAPAAAPVVGAGLRGTITVADALKAQVKSGFVFIMARPIGGGMPIAVKKLPFAGPGALPLSFELTAKDTMMAGTAFTGEVRLQVRLDADGDALSKQPGDIHGAKEPVKIGAEPVALELSEIH